MSVGLKAIPSRVNEGIDNEEDNASIASHSSDGSSEAESRFRDPPYGFVRLRPSSFNHIPSTVFVEYPPELKLKRQDVSTLEPLGLRKLIYSSHWERICIRNAFLRAGFENNPNKKEWTALWSKHQNDAQMKGLNCLQKVNHFPASWCVGRKDRLARTMQAMQRVNGMAEFGFHPENFILPVERDALFRQVVSDQASCKNRKGATKMDIEKSSMWIIKPVASSCGKGIKVITGQQVLSLPKTKRALVQRYLHSPYLIDGKKFDLRIYVLISGVDPLRVYIHSEGLTRISTSDYSLKNLSNRFAHLTNYSINKKSKNFKAASFDDGSPNRNDQAMQEAGNDGTAATTQTADADTEGFKWSLAAFKRWLSRKESPEIMQATFMRIHDLCVKTMIAAESTITPQLHSSANYRSNCFELFGCDVILDSDLIPHLLEVNVSPSLMGSSPLDKRIKGAVIADTLHIVGLYPHDAKQLKKYGNAAESDKSSTMQQPLPINPFAFGSLSKMMTSQDAWRRSPSPLSVDVAALGNTDCAWMLLLTCEDEFDRAASTEFQRVHPTADNLVHYCSLYRNGRFSDHMLGRWVIENGSKGPLRSLIPPRFFRAEPIPGLIPVLDDELNPHPPPVPKATCGKVGKPLSAESPLRLDKWIGSVGMERPLILSSRNPSKATLHDSKLKVRQASSLSPRVAVVQKSFGIHSIDSQSQSALADNPPPSPNLRPDGRMLALFDRSIKDSSPGSDAISTLKSSVSKSSPGVPRPRSAVAFQVGSPRTEIIKKIGIEAVSDTIVAAMIQPASNSQRLISANNSSRERIMPLDPYEYEQSHNHSAHPSTLFCESPNGSRTKTREAKSDKTTAIMQRQLLYREQKKRQLADSMGAIPSSYINGPSSLDSRLCKPNKYAVSGSLFLDLRKGDTAGSSSAFKGKTYESNHPEAIPAIAFSHAPIVTATPETLPNIARPSQSFSVLYR